MYKILYHKLVLKDDFRDIPSSDKKTIIKTMEKKLTADPEAFGRPLGSELKGYFRLRIGIYRVIYRVDRGEVIVFVLKAGLRKDLKVYFEAAKRLKLL